VFLKVLNIVVIVLLSDGGFLGNWAKSFVVFGTPYAYAIINLFVLVAILLDEVSSKKMVGVSCRLFLNQSAFICIRHLKWTNRQGFALDFFKLFNY